MEDSTPGNKISPGVVVQRAEGKTQNLSEDKLANFGAHSVAQPIFYEVPAVSGHLDGQGEENAQDHVDDIFGKQRTRHVVNELSKMVKAFKK